MANNKKITIPDDDREAISSFMRSIRVPKDDIDYFLDSSLTKSIYKYYLSRRDFVVEQETRKGVLPFSKIPKSFGQGGVDELEKEFQTDDRLIEKEKRKGRGKGKKPVKQITSVAFEPELLDQLKCRAEQEERSIGALIRIAVKQYLKGD